MSAQRPASERTALPSGRESDNRSDFIVQDYLQSEYAAGNAAIIRVNGWYMNTEPLVSDTYSG